LSPVGATYARGLAAWTLSFVHSHTGETLTSVYFEGGRYVPSSLARINVLLRDFRTEDVYPIDPGVLDILFELRSLVGADAPFHVISGYRSPRTNTALRSRSKGVAEHSFHLQGPAVMTVNVIEEAHRSVLRGQYRAVKDHDANGVGEIHAHVIAAIHRRSDGL
jgi:uncharacterized protein YcbK (DUF882 family)